MDLFSYDAEVSLIGSAMLDNSLIPDLADVVRPEDLQEPACRLLWGAIINLAAQGKSADVVTISERLEATGQLDEVGGVEGISTMAINTPSSRNAITYATILSELAQRRAVIGAVLNIEESARDRSKPLAEVVNSSKAMIEGCLRAGYDRLPSMKDRLKVVVDNLDAKWNGDTEVMGTSTGIKDLDEMILGLRPGLTIVGARPSMGKSTFMVQCMAQAGVTDRPVLCQSMEMPASALVERMICNVGDIPIAAFKDPANCLEDEHWPRVTVGINRLTQAPIYIDEKPSRTVSHVRARAKELYEAHGSVGLIVVDYVQKMVPEGKHSRKDLEMEEIIVGLNNIGKEYNCPVVALAQLNRQVEQRPNKRPVMSDLKESSAFEQEADVILFLYRDEIYNPDNIDAKGIAELIVAKQREGVVGTVYSAARLGNARFDDLAPKAFAKDGFDS